MIGTPPAVAFLFGVAVGFVIPKRAIHALGGLMRQRVNNWVHEHFLETIVIVLVLAILGCGVAFIGFGYSIASNRAQSDAAHQLATNAKRQAAATDQKFAHYRACVNHYARQVHISQTQRTIAAQRLDDARSRVEGDSRRLWSLVAKSVAGHKVSPDVAKKALGIYLSDSAAEQRLHAALTEARLKNPIPFAPDKACP